MKVDVDTFRATGAPRISIYDMTLEEVITLRAALEATVSLEQLEDQLADALKSLDD